MNDVNTMSDLDIFMALVDAGTLAGAARRLSLAPISVKKGLQRLEEALGTSLVLRDGHDLILTAAGEALHDRLSDVFAHIHDTISALSNPDDALSGSLKVIASLSIGRRLIEPLVASFSRLYPALQIHLHLEDRRVDFIRDGYDLAITLGEPQDSSLVARRLLSNRCFLVASPTYIREAAPLHRAQDIRLHRCLALDSQGALNDLWPLRSTHAGEQGQRARQENIKIAPNMTTDDSDVYLAWLRAGKGLGVVGEQDVIDDLRRRTLVHVLPDYRLPNLDYYLVFAGRRNLPQRTRLLIEYLDAHLAPPA